MEIGGRLRAESRAMRLMVDLYNEEYDFEHRMQRYG
jgi:hypothetical protein